MLEGITHRFGDMVAADDIGLDIRPGELVSLLGPSGCGKTTLLKIVAGFLRQTAGDVLVDGQSISHLPPNRRRIGIVFQNYALFPHMTVAENVGYGLAAAGRHKSEIAAVVGEMLDVVQMAAFGGRLPRELSGGQQQRIALARCLAIRPRILLLDEPFSALDKNLRLDMQIEIKRLQRRSGITTILVTHDQEEALGISDRIAVLSRGHLEQFASPTDIYDRPASLFVNTFVGTANLIRATVVAIAATGATVRAGDVIVETPIATTLAPGAAALLSVRPETLRIGRAPGGLPARVTAVMPIGPSLIYEVALGDGTPVKVVQDRAAADTPLDGDVFLTINTGRISGLFPDPAP
ncbi:MAG: Fe3+/spermidine/putrescine ABC transporter ATP-binding protein [Azorhizobium sp. 39-67-5]|nr:MAG: Fe3+/spermidine/putrescine ABC transporter ATP-binding protein [Azorhizobium sp. 39-67-5]